MECAIRPMGSYRGRSITQPIGAWRAGIIAALGAATAQVRPGKGSAFGPFRQDSHRFGPSKNYSSPDAAGDRYNETSRWEGEPY